MTFRDNPEDSDRTAFSAAVANAQAAVAGLSEQYIGWVNDDLKRLDAAIAAVSDGGNTPALQAVYDVAHDIKGQGSTFGYQLVTDIGQLLCRYVAEAIQRKSVDGEIIAAHAAALRTVVDNRIQGQAGEIGKEILETLKAAAAKSFA
ncbi:Hpt domain-containing protein [Ferrovibrio sp.]|uniref:Hpt domain-containing protein n=1 Tax=Ferrovibrio sp. TaxID=1917215 RepID=UPI0026267D4A|nr:Hpt domain-containing protein [Ferrovibrio sp.]